MDIQQWDEAVLRLVNVSWDSPLLDSITSTARMPYTWLPVYLAIAAWLLLKYKWVGLLAIACIALGFGLVDAGSARILKPYFARLRPCNDLEVSQWLRHVVVCGSGHSFPSNHAANHTLFSTLVILLGRPKPAGRLALVCWPLFIMFSQVHVGVHYLTDVLGGALWGLSVALLLFTIYRLASRRWIARFN